MEQNNDWLYHSDAFQTFFKTSERSLILKANPPYFTILAASDHYLRITHRERHELIGKNMFEVYPGSQADPAEKNSVYSSFMRVIGTKQTDVLPTFKYEIINTETGTPETVYWSNINEPLPDQAGNVAYLVNTTADITAQVQQQEAAVVFNKETLVREQQMNENLTAANVELRSVNAQLQQSQEHLLGLKNELEERVENRTRQIKSGENRFRSLIEQIPAAINVFLTDSLVVDLPNDRMLEIWGRTFDEVAGKPLDVGMPELKGQPFMQKLRDVITTGIPYSSTEEKAFIKRNGKLEECYFDIIYQPVINEDGSITSCLQIASEVTEEVLARHKIQALNEELAATNEELTAANEELAAAGEELTDANKLLAEAVQQSEIQRERLNTFFMQAPAGICVLDGPDLVFELVNPGYQKLLPGRKLMGRPLFKALPELAGTPLQDTLLDVYRNGKEITFTEQLIQIADYEGGPLHDRYFTFHYMPRKNESGQSDGILAFVFEVTDAVAARRKVEQAEENLRIATESAELGTWSYYADGGRLVASPRFKEIFGVAPDKELLHEYKMSLIHPDYKPAVKEAMQASLEKGLPLSLEYPVTDGTDDRQKWVRVVGKRIQDNSLGVYITGMVADITEQKRDEQRKNDFIGMVSHEMKTPLTSLNGYMQLLRMRTISDDDFTLSMLDKANKQINRITTLINGFLNVSRLEAGKIYIDKNRFDMAALVKEAEEEVRSTINSHQVVFAPVETTWVNADRDKINQVISNLIGNAVKYSPANTIINVACVTEGSHATFTVTDRGIGIKPEDQPKLFDRYYRVNNDNATSASGFGIGLYLCYEIIRRHDGKIWVESEVGKGSTFSFLLPVIG